MLKRNLSAALAVALALGLGAAVTFRVLAQHPEPGPIPTVPSNSSPSPDDSTDPSLLQMQKRQAMLQNAQRQRDLVKDTNKLLQLATELKDEVDKTNQNVLSVDVVKKATEIEKLAKSVREKMKGY